jgi:hypothetical protein
MKGIYLSGTILFLIIGIIGFCYWTKNDTPIPGHPTDTFEMIQKK